jgi:hypothetical protein
MIIESYKIGALYFIKNPYRRDLDSFATTPSELAKQIEKNSTSYAPIIYEVEFFKQIPKFKKLTKTELKNLFGVQLGEKVKGRAKDYNNYNPAQKWEVPPSKRKVAARNVKKKTTKKR